MYTLLDFTNKDFAEYFNSALRRHGLDSYVFAFGLGPDGEEIFSVACLNASELQQARYLIYSSRYFLNDIHPEAAEKLREIRKRHAQGILELATSRPVIIFSVLALAAATLGYLLDL
ncbi:hypothetical protein [Pseudomonas sp. LFM046]|uniref:hypothetical protein n=1 Tax=Pseudomonas sp. LFM046 TaxID=1608357 RepID=UPI0011AF3FB1|nr:hypothetical protein [Pseudomonas sp. LFM046]